MLPGNGLSSVRWIVVLIAFIPLVERMYAKMRLFEVPQLFASATVLALASIGLRIAVSAHGNRSDLAVCGRVGDRFPLTHRARRVCKFHGSDVVARLPHPSTPAEIAFVATLSI